MDRKDVIKIKTDVENLITFMNSVKNNTLEKGYIKTIEANIDYLNKVQYEMSLLLDVVTYYEEKGRNEQKR